MNKELIDLINKKTAKENFEYVKENIKGMISPKSAVPLEEKTLYEVLNGEGEFFLLKASYQDFNLDKENKLLDLKLKEALCVTVCFEDDGSLYSEIEKFVKYIYAHTTLQQKFYFGIKQVEQLSDYPVKILLSEIYPINQLQMHLGKKVDAFIKSDVDYFKEYFALVRGKISDEIGIALLPLDIIVDDKICDKDVVLLDSVTKEKIVAFSIEHCEDRKALDIYLLKLYYVFLKLGAKYKH